MRHMPINFHYAGFFFLSGATRSVTSSEANPSKVTPSEATPSEATLSEATLSEATSSFPRLLAGTQRLFVNRLNGFLVWLADRYINERHWVPAKSRGNDGGVQTNHKNSGVQMNHETNILNSEGYIPIAFPDIDFSSPSSPRLLAGTQRLFLNRLNGFFVWLADRYINERHWVPAKSRGNDGGVQTNHKNGGVQTNHKNSGVQMNHKNGGVQMNHETNILNSDGYIPIAFPDINFSSPSSPRFLAGTQWLFINHVERFPLVLAIRQSNERHWVPARSRRNDGKKSGILKSARYLLNHRLRSLCLALLCGTLAACQPAVDVAPGLDARNANDIQSVFIQNGITAERTDTRDSVSLTVKQADLPRALAVMREAGLPRERQASMGDVFRKEGMVSTPLEERVRYLYALSQELERTLLQIDGVLVARVHVVLPDRVSPGDPLNPSSASVFIKYRPGTQIDQAAPRIVQLVADSIPGLSDSAASKVSLITMPAANNPAPVQTSSQHNSSWWLVLAMAVLGGGATAVGAWILGQRGQQNRSAPEQSEQSALVVGRVK